MSNQYVTIDNHVHVAGPGDRYHKDLYWHDRFKDGVGFWGLKMLKGWTFKKVTDEMMIKALLNQTRKMQETHYAVVLAFDHVHDVDGNLKGSANEDLTTLYVSNEFVDKLCELEHNLLLGVSVHPFRDDAVDRLEKFSDRTVLCKWMGSAMMIDFANPKAKVKLNKFFDALIRLKLPLLAHAGVETSIPCKYEEAYKQFNRPRYYEEALDRGVTVIVAHCGCSYFDYIIKQDDSMRKEAIAMFEEMKNERKDWKLYGDISALFSFCRNWDNLKEILRKVPKERLIYGTDFPNPAKGRKERVGRVFKRFAKVNLFNKYHKIATKALNENLGENHGVFTNFHRLLINMDRGDIIDKKNRLKENWGKPPIDDVLAELDLSLA